MPLISATTNFKVTLGAFATVSITGHNGHTTEVQYRNQGGWHTYTGGSGTTDRNITVHNLSRRIRVKITGGTGDVFVGLTPIEDDYIVQLVESSGIGDFLADGSIAMTGDLAMGGNNIANGGVIFLTEQASADADVAGKGQWWVDTNGIPRFTPDTGTDSTLLTEQQSAYGYIYVPAGAMIPRTTNGATATTTELATNDIMVDTMEFVTGTEQGAGFWVTFPVGWDTSLDVKVRFHWTTLAGSAGGVTWGISARSYANDEAIDQAQPASIDVDDTWLADGDLHITDASSAISITGMADTEPVYFEVTRAIGDANYTMGADAGLIGVQIEYARKPQLTSAI